MPDYQNGKIYKILSLANPNLIYVGSTTQPLNERFYNHKSEYNRFQQNKSRFTTCFTIFENCDDYSIELIEDYPCNSKEELFKREGYWINQFNCVNKRIAGRTKTEWYKDNKNKKNEYAKQYRENNKEKIKEYRNSKQEQLKEYLKSYYETHKEEQNKKILCETCNCYIVFKNRNRHHLTQKHIEMATEKPDDKV